MKCVSNDIRVPADAEWCSRATDPRGHVEAEGPYGEFLGYYGAQAQPVFHLTAITRRHDALFQTSTIGAGAARTDTALPNALRTEVMIWRAPRPRYGTGHATASSGGMFNLRVALRQRPARRGVAACFNALVNVKNVFIVDSTWTSSRRGWTGRWRPG